MVKRDFKKAQAGDYDGQMEIPGSSTDLSRAADDYLLSLRRRDELEARIKTAKDELIVIMRKHKKTSFTHRGFRISFRLGRTTESSVVVQNNRDE